MLYEVITHRVEVGFSGNRAAAIHRMPEFDALRDEGVAIKTHVLDHLDYYLEKFEAKVVENGGQVQNGLCFGKC